MNNLDDESKRHSLLSGCDSNIEEIREKYKESRPVEIYSYEQKKESRD